MFVRFRERMNDSRKPRGVGAALACPHPERCAKRDGSRAGPGHRYGRGCPRHPHCRWRIGWKQGLGLIPYRLLVSLVANKRIDGKVRQEHVADLGAIDGHCLPGFYSGVDASIAKAIRNEDWSIAMRLNFWGRLDQRLAQLSNQIEAGEADKICAAIQVRIPKPTDAEIERMEIGGWERLLSGWQGLAADEQKAIAKAEAEIAEKREAITEAQSVIDMIAENLKRLPGDFAAVQAMAGERNDMDTGFLRILIARLNRYRGTPDA